MDHDLKVDGVAGIGIAGLRLVAEGAELRILPRAAVCTERVVAVVAARGEVDLVPLGRDGRAVGAEVVFDVRVVVLRQRRVDAGRRRGRVTWMPVVGLRRSNPAGSTVLNVNSVPRPRSVNVPVSVPA
jgi:hypothetical protein